MALTKVDISLMENTTGFTIVTKVVTVAASKLVIDGVSQDTLTLTEGYTYKFDTSHATMSGHTVSFATAADAAGSTQYTTGVTTNGTPGNAGAYTQIIVAQSAPALYYYCANHASMGGTISTPTAVIANKLLAYDGSGNLPVVDGSQLTGISTGITESSSDPTISTNPSGGVGTEWCNTTSGEVFICTDATAGSNVWTNVGGGSDGIEPFYPYGDTSGYTIGGHTGSSGTDVKDKFSFTSDGNATDVGNALTTVFFTTGASSTTYGYHAGAAPLTDTIQRFSFASDGDSEDVGNLFLIRNTAAGFSSSTHGYKAGGGNASTPNDEGLNGIEKYAFGSSTTGTDVGNLTMNVMSGSGTMSLTHGYRQGGRISGTYQDVIERFAFSSDGDSADVGNLITAVSNCSVNGQNSSTHGYAVSGEGTGNATRIQKYQFAASSNATAVGTLTVGSRSAGAGQSSTTHGYASGGPDTPLNVIEKFSFTSDGNSSDVGDLIVARKGMAGCSS